MGTSTPAPQVPFKVTGQEARTDIGSDGRQTLVWRVSFTTPSGYKSYVDVPKASYNANTVAAMISQDVAHIEAVGKLGND